MGPIFLLISLSHLSASSTLIIHNTRRTPERRGIHKGARKIARHTHMGRDMLPINHTPCCALSLSPLPLTPVLCPGYLEGPVGEVKAVTRVASTAGVWPAGITAVGVVEGVKAVRWHTRRNEYLHKNNDGAILTDKKLNQQRSTPTVISHWQQP